MSTVQEIVVPHTVEVYDNNNGFYLKTFLLDSSTAKNGMGVKEEFIGRHINKFVGKPVILTQDLYHPHEFEHYKETGDYQKDLQEYSKLQQPYIIGTISSVDTSSNLQQAGGIKYSAILEITDEKAIAAFKQGKVPLYVSPSIYRVNSKDPVHSITDYEPLHIAIVDSPAYGFHKANIRANCQGNVTECSRMLAQAGNGLSYCVEKKLSELTNLLQASNSSHSGNSTLNTSVHALENNNTNENANSQSVQEQSNVQEQKQETVEQKIQEQQQKAQVTPINTPVPNVSGQKLYTVQDSNITEAPKTEEAPSKSENTEETPCDKARSEYEAKLSELENDIKTFKEFKANYEKTAAETKIQTKRSRIENVVPVGYAGSEEERNKAVESLMNVQDEQLDVILNSFVVPATRNIKQGGLRQRPKVTDYVKSQEKQVAQASVSKLGAKDIENLEKILNFGYGGIVPKKQNSGGIA